MLTRRNLLGGAALVGSMLLRRAALGAETPPNIVLFLADDLGYGDLSSYGAPDIQTPNIDGIAQRGIRFTQFYANAPECTPTRAALLTGRYQQRVGGLECAIGVGDQGRYDEAIWLQKKGELGLPTSEVTLPRILSELGYECGCFGKWHLGYPKKFWPNRHGFDESFGVIGGNADYFLHTEAEGRPALYRNEDEVKQSGYMTDLIAAEAVKWLRRPGLKRGSVKPFFLYVPFTAPHQPIQDPDGLDEKTGTAPAQPGNRKIYAKMVEVLDKRVGAVLGEIESMGAIDNTIVIFASDNGGDANGRNLPYRGRKSQLFEGGIRVPCMIQWTGKLPAGVTSDQVTMTMDLAPTLLSATGKKPKKKVSFDGEDLLAIWKGEQPVRPRTIYWRYKRAENRRKAVRDGDWKFIEDNQDEYLFDLAKDPSEKTNLLDQASAKAQQYRDMIAKWEQSVAAPRLKNYKPTA